MEHFLLIFVLIPALGFLTNVFIPRTNEKLMSNVAYSTMALQFLTTIGFLVYWFINYHQTLYSKEITFYKTSEVELFLDFCFDKISAVYLIVGAFLSFLIIAYSRTYLHREGGYKRFFNTIMLFYLGYNVLVLSGNLATFFIGWELAGISSFLLIGFYRDRYIPVRNAVKIFSIYRIADLAFILAIWSSHQIWHQNIVLLEFDNREAVLDHIINYPSLSVFFSIMILIAASIKSAQIPFSSWLPRAMEGPTPSSAIFYSSLSVHAGLLLLLRTDHFWMLIPGIKVSIIVIGALTFLIAGSTARVQANAKAQIAYSSIAQIGLMFIETAFGLEWLVLIHFAGNAFLRSYQLLISPSVVTYQVRERFYRFIPDKIVNNSAMLSKIRDSVYILSLEEWFMDEFMHHTIWNFLKRIGKRLNFITAKHAVTTTFLIVASVSLMSFTDVSTSPVQLIAALLITFISVLFSLRSFAEKRNVTYAWFLVAVTHVFISISVGIVFPIHFQHVLLYLGGVAVSAVSGYLLIRYLQRDGVTVTLNWYQGHCYEYPKTNFGFLLCCLGLIGFPITSTFIGIELYYGYIDSSHFVLLAFFSLNLLINSLSLIRIYSRIFLGPHVKTYHAIARKSS